MWHVKVGSMHSSQASQTHSKLSLFLFAGDPGSALFIVNNGVYTVVGLVSAARASDESCDVGYNQFYTDVAHYRAWIEEVVFETY